VVRVLTEGEGVDAEPRAEVERAGSHGRALAPPPHRQRGLGRHPNHRHPPPAITGDPCACILKSTSRPPPSSSVYMDSIRWDPTAPFVTRQCNHQHDTDGRDAMRRSHRSRVQDPLFAWLLAHRIGRWWASEEEPRWLVRVDSRWRWKVGPPITGCRRKGAAAGTTGRWRWGQVHDGSRKMMEVGAEAQRASCARATGGARARWWRGPGEGR
jgi:hypothetical protein